MGEHSRYEVVKWAQSQPLKLGAKSVLVALAMHFPRIFPSASYLAEETGLSMRRVRYHIAQLRQGGYIQVKSGGGRTCANSYQLIIDGVPATPQPKAEPKPSQPSQRATRNYPAKPSRPPDDDPFAAVRGLDLQGLYGKNGVMWQSVPRHARYGTYDLLEEDD